MNKKIKFYLPFFLTLILFLSMINLSGDGWRNMTWVPAGAPYNTERYAAGCAVQYEQAGTTATYIYIFGGNYNGYLNMGLSNRVFRYDPWADLQGQSCWTQMANMPYSAYDFGVESGVRDGIVRLYLFAGYGPAYRNTIYEYTPITNTFLLRRTMSTREGTTQIGSVGGKLYAIGGDDGSNFLTINQEYNPATNGLLNRFAEPQPRGDQAVVSVGDSVIFCIGGAYGSLAWADYANSNYMYKPSDNSWTTQDPRGYLASGAVGGYFNDIIYNFSGGNSATYLRTVGRYRVSTGAWLGNGPDMPAVQDGAVCGVVTHFYKPTPFNLLTPTNGSTVGSLKPTLTWESSDRTKGPRIWVITGGTDGSNTTARNSAYTITSDTTSANDTLLYTLYYSLEAIVDAPVDSIVDLTTNSYTFTSDLEADTVYYWKVKRTDYYEETERWSNQLDWWFRTPPAVAIELSSFSAWLYQGDIKIIWRTESEKDNVRWLIERSYEKADNYILIGTVEGQGNKPTPTDYTFTDKGVSKEGRYFYRLGAINSQGEIKWNGPVSVIYRVREVGSSILSVLPSGSGNVKINYIIGESSNTRIELFDLTGRRIATLLEGRKEPGKFSLTWNGRMSNGSYAPRGIYFCRIQFGSLSKVVKFVYMK